MSDIKAEFDEKFPDKLYHKKDIVEAVRWMAERCASSAEVIGFYASNEACDLKQKIANEIRKLSKDLSNDNS